MIPSPSYTVPYPPTQWLFRKLYDGSPNLLGGNCLTGQLLSQGYYQEYTMGEIAKKKYIGRTDATTGDFKLFDTPFWTELNTEKIYFRSDDVERTLLSGQSLLSGMFKANNDSAVVFEAKDPIIEWHTGDYVLDQIYPNSIVCPALNALEAAAIESVAYQRWHDSSSSKILMNTANAIFGEGMWSWDAVLDCLMTTVCSGREIPGDMTQDIFDNLVAHVEYNFSYIALYNNSAWAKVATNQIGYNILGELRKAQANSESAMSFVLYSGHDTTLMSFLAAVLGSNWDKQWAAYASMISIELYNSSVPGGSDLFRIIYNGVSILMIFYV